MLRLIPILLVVLPLSLAACSGGEEPATDPDPVPEATSDATPEAAVEATPEAAPEATPAATATRGQPSPSVVIDERTGFSVNSRSIPTAAGTYIGGINTWCEPADTDHVRPGANVSPHVDWKQPPEGTKSFALVMHDPDAPIGSPAFNKEGISIPIEEPRSDFFHWVLVDIPATLTELAEGVEGKGVSTAAPKQTEHGLQGANGFGGPDAPVGGYGGPCPPWNDDLIHRYVFTMYALDVETLGLSGAFDGPAAREAMKGHILAEASFTGLFWTNPAIRPDVQ